MDFNQHVKDNALALSYIKVFDCLKSESEIELTRHRSAVNFLEKTIKFLTAHKKYRILWWGFGPTLLEDLCKEKKFLDKKNKKQCIELLKAFSERKVYW